MMERRRTVPATPVRAILFDFDGTLSTLRHGWERVMEPLMIEMIAGPTRPDQALVEEVRRYIDESTGIQTIHQMAWLAEAVARYGLNPNAAEDAWAYKAEYNRRLMQSVMQRRKALLAGEVLPEAYLMAGSHALLSALRARGIALFVASGTDDPDVNAEAEALGLASFFTLIRGAPLGVVGCSKETVMRRLLESGGYAGEEVCVIGDGKVEIAIGRENGARTLGVAGDEAARRGIDAVKRERLVKADADAIVSDFLALDDILAFLGW